MHTSGTSHTIFADMHTIHSPSLVLHVRGKDPGRAVYVAVHVGPTATPIQLVCQRRKPRCFYGQAGLCKRNAHRRTGGGMVWGGGIMSLCTGPLCHMLMHTSADGHGDELNYGHHNRVQSTCQQ